jgi:murein DD-endopeptidase MepM/ murein hydrolase activator NlpD
VADRFDLRPESRRRTLRLVGGAAGLILASLAVAAFLRDQPAARRMLRLRQFWADPERHAAWTIQAGRRCDGASFVMPTDGYIGFFWHDTFRLGQVHQGLDIFGPTGPDGLGQTPVVAAYDGYLTRLPSWHSAVILRVPNDPFQSGRQIWLYYTHMADARGRSFIEAEFPPGTRERFVETGTLLGYQGDYSGDPANPVGMHLHFSIVKDDGQGVFKNELDVGNTLDPSPYLGFELDARQIGDRVAVCANPEG